MLGLKPVRVEGLLDAQINDFFESIPINDWYSFRKSFIRKKWRSVLFDRKFIGPYCFLRELSLLRLVGLDIWHPPIF
jgi:myosin-crossreactive antigen